MDNKFNKSSKNKTDNFDEYVKEYKPNSKNVMTDFSSSSCSVNDCTGLIPNGDNQTEETFENYKDIYPFSTPNNDI